MNERIFIFTYFFIQKKAQKKMIYESHTNIEKKKYFNMTQKVNT